MKERERADVTLLLIFRYTSINWSAPKNLRVFTGPSSITGNFILNLCWIICLYASFQCIVVHCSSIVWFFTGNLFGDYLETSRKYLWICKMKRCFFSHTPKDIQSHSSTPPPPLAAWFLLGIGHLHVVTWCLHVVTKVIFISRRETMEMSLYWCVCSSFIMSNKPNYTKIIGIQ